MLPPSRLSKFHCPVANPKRSSPLLQYIWVVFFFLLNYCYILFYCLSSELLASQRSGEVVLIQVLASPQRRLSNAIGILQMWPKPSRRGSGTKASWSAPSSSSHDLPETTQFRGTSRSISQLCGELRNGERWPEEHNLEQSARRHSLRVTTESISSKTHSKEISLSPNCQSAWTKRLQGTIVPAWRKLCRWQGLSQSLRDPPSIISSWSDLIRSPL